MNPIYGFFFFLFEIYFQFNGRFPKSIKQFRFFSLYFHVPITNPQKWITHSLPLFRGFPGGDSGIKNLPANAGDIRDTDLIPGSRRSPGKGHSNPLQYSCLENSVARGARRATVHRVTESRT